MDRRFFLLSASATVAASAQHPRPSAIQIDNNALSGFREALARRNTHSLLILRGEETILEWYETGRDARTPHYMASATKALVGGSSLLFAMNDGRIRANDRAAKYIPQWHDDPKKSEILIRHLATHTSGLEDSSVPGVAHPNEPGWKGRFWKRNDPDPFTIAIQETPLLFAPGEGYEYSNPGMAALAYAVTASLHGAPHEDIRGLLAARLFRPLEIPEELWQIGYNKPVHLDGMDVYANWGGANMAPRATAKIARWMMQGGAYQGKQLVAHHFATQMLKYAGMRLPDRRKDAFAPGSGLCWYTNFDGVWPTVPRDAFAAGGAGHQLVLVIPSLELILVRNGNALTGDGEQPYWTAAYKHVFEPLMLALGNPVRQPSAPYPQSKRIRGVEFAPESSIRRLAIDSDNWPMTWADDGNVYTSYGDGFGFEPRVRQKLGMGFAKLEGGFADLHGSNIRTETGERLGDGVGSPKASGLIMVGGVLYMWVRNVGNSQVVSSKDHGRTWDWGFKVEQGFGSPAFLNCGRNYSGAPDSFVYAYSQQGPSAYELDDGVVLARAPKTRLLDKSAWRFCSGASPEGEPAWTADPAAAKPIFQFPGHCQRVDAMYHAPLKRYLLVVGYGHNGGWGIFEASAPWGPWATVFHTEYWGLGETHGYRLCPKWVSADGKTLGLVFSGLIYNGVSYDAFCTREMKLQIAG